MIRALQKADIDSVAEIWLDTNRKAHAFIPASYWERNFASVKQMLPQAEVYVYETDQGIQGFLGLNGEYIEGIFRFGGGAVARHREVSARLRQGQKAGVAPERVSEECAGDPFLPTGGVSDSAQRAGCGPGEPDYEMLWRRE